MSVASMNTTTKTDMSLLAGMLEKETPFLNPERPQAALSAREGLACQYD